MKLPRFDTSRSHLELMNPVFKNLFEIRFKPDDSEKLLSNQVIGYEVIDTQIKIRFNANQETCAQQSDEYKRVSEIELIWHDKTGHVFFKTEFIDLNLKQVNFSGDYKSSDLQTIEVIWGYRNKIKYRNGKN